MISLIISIITSSLLYVIFKYFKRFGINIQQAITVNYWVAFGLGWCIAPQTVNFEIFARNRTWLLLAGFLGLLFIAVFNVMALTSQRNGVSVASVASKMSLVIPVFMGVYLYNESIGLLKITGVITALLAVYLTAVKPKTENKSRLLLLPLLLFLGSGVIDTLIKYAEGHLISAQEHTFFVSVLFLSAALSGLLISGIQRNWRFTGKSILAGVILGIPNYFSVLYLIKSLASGWESSTIFTINHVGIVTLSTCLGLLLFREKISVLNRIGIALAVLSIFLVINN